MAGSSIQRISTSRFLGIEVARYEIVSSAFLASPASVLGTPAFDPYPGLIISVRIPGYSLAILPLLQFNGDTGSTSYSFSVSDNLAIASTGVSGTATGLQMCQTSGLALAEWIADIQNPAGAEHGITWKGCRSE